jgi:mRNA interferase MazF
MGAARRERIVVTRRYVPDAGDLVWLTFDPQAGHEQAGRRPALVLSPRTYNGKAGLALMCPVTTQRKGYPFEVAIDSGPIHGVALADQMKSLDWQARQATRAARATDTAMIEVLERIRALLGL